MGASRRPPICSSPSTRSGPTGSRPPTTSPGSSCASQTAPSRRSRSRTTDERSGLDLVRDRRLVRADRPRRHVRGDRDADHAVAAPVRRARASDRPARCRRLRDQEARHVVLHGRARDLRLPRLDDGRRRRRSGWPSCPRSTTSTRPTSGSSAHGFWTYDFVLPGLLLHAFETGQAQRLVEHLAASPDRQFTNLDCHDGIPVRPDLDGILTPGEMAGLAAHDPGAGGNVNRILSRRRMRRPATCTSSTAPTTRRSPRTTSDTWPRARSSCSPGASRRSTTSACSPARTITRRSSDRRGPRDQPARLHRRRDRSRARAARRQRVARPGPTSEHAPGVRR